jgi:hypothetical protein
LLASQLQCAMRDARAAGWPGWWFGGVELHQRRDSRRGALLHFKGLRKMCAALTALEGRYGRRITAVLNKKGILHEELGANGMSKQNAGKPHFGQIIPAGVVARSAGRAPRPAGRRGCPECSACCSRRGGSTEFPPSPSSQGRKRRCARGRRPCRVLTGGCPGRNNKAFFFTHT